MKFLVTWQVHEGKLHDTLALFSKLSMDQERALMGKGVTLISRWHDVLRGSGAAVFEADSAESLSAYALNWNRFMDLDIAVVVDDDGAREIGRGMQSGG